MTPISICIIAKNEEKNMETFLSRIIKHTEGYPIEILIADTGSTDTTTQIASRFPVRLLHFDWIHDFSAARNFTLQQAAHDWILVLDCDEYIEELNMEGLQYFIQNHPESIGMLTRKNHSRINGFDSIYSDQVERFFNRKYFHYESIIHEQVRALDHSSLKRVAIPLTVDHNSYVGTPEEMQAKAKRNNDLLLKMLEQTPDDPYLYFQIGQSYSSIKDTAKAAYYYGKGLEYEVEPSLEYVQLMVISYGYALLDLGQLEDALLFESIYEAFSGSADFVCLMGLIYLRNGLINEAIEEFLKATTFTTAKVEGANSFIPTYNLGCINEVLGDIETATALYKSCGRFKPALDRLDAINNLQK